MKSPRCWRYIDDTMANAYLAMLLYLQSEDAKKPVSVPAALLAPIRHQIIFISYYYVFMSCLWKVQIYFSSPGAALKPARSLDGLRLLADTS